MRAVLPLVDGVDAGLQLRERRRQGFSRLFELARILGLVQGLARLFDALDQIAMLSQAIAIEDHLTFDLFCL